jgi:hypothetical protein
MYELKCQNLTNFMRYSVHGCFAKCATRNDVPMLTVKEGLCFRNCLTKLGSFVPSMKQSMQGTSAMHYNNQAQAVSVEDPWGSEKEALMQKMMEKQA